MSTKSVAHQAIEAVIERLKTIRLVDGYNTDAGHHVQWARRFVSQDDLPGIVVWRNDETPETNTQDRLDMRLTLALEGHVAAERADTGQALEYLLADIKKTVFVRSGVGRGLVTTDVTNGLANNVVPIGVTAVARDDGQISEAVQVIIEIQFPELYGDPYQIL